MNSELLKPIKGCDIGIQPDMWGNESIYVAKPKTEFMIDVKQWVNENIRGENDGN